MTQREWRPITLKRRVSFDGGYMKKACTLDSQEIHTPAGEKCFVKIDKGAEWLNRGACGQRAHAGSLKRSQVFEALKQKLIINCSARCAICLLRRRSCGRCRSCGR